MKITVQWRPVTDRLLSTPYLLAVVALIYVGMYLTLATVPGNSPLQAPLGWWAWFDQGQYLKSAKAFHALDFSAEHYFYPPLYPALGSIFLFGTEKHPFFIVNLICLLWFVYVLVRLCDLYVPRIIGVFLLFASTILPLLVFENFVIPWTSNLSVALLATGILGLIWVQEIQAGTVVKLANWQVLLVATSLGLMVPTRPVDALIGFFIGCVFILGYLRLPKMVSHRKISNLRFLILVITGALLGPALFLGFNLLVHKALLGNYLQVASSHGFFMADLLEKFYSIWINAQPLYGEVGAGLIEHYPWLLISLAGLVWVILCGDFLTRTLALAIIIFFILYLPYGDLLPTGMWRFLNIHYFKWTFPIFALFSAILIGRIVQAIQTRSSWALPGAVLILVPLLLLSLQMRIITSPAHVRYDPKSSLSLDLPEHAIDFVDIKGLTGQFDAIYFGDHVLKLDDQALKLYRDFRLLDHGADIRILFIRPIKGHRLELSPDLRLQTHDEQLNAQWGNYQFGFSLSAAPSQLQSQIVPAAYHLNQVINFSNQGISHFYILEGFSIAENQGRWTINEKALVNLRVIDFSPDKKATLDLTYRALLTESKPCQQVLIFLNQREIGSNRLCLSDNDHEPQTYHYELPIGIVGKEGLVQIQIETPNTVSARQLKINTDDRKLGVYLQSLVLTQ